ncbi:MAG: hypothetical protein JNK78_08935 [Planctomycetes bacterium]|nr:hypothetical protein [Planctomycetota bacterium]
MKILAPLLLTLAVATTRVNAQAPIPWPLGAPVPTTIENNGTAPLSYMFCTPTVTDAAGQPVTTGLCAFAFLQLPPGETSTTHWLQTDDFGAPVPPGLYFVNGVPFAIGAADAALRSLGSPHPGSTRAIELASPNDPNAPYIVAAAFSSTNGFSLGCGVQFPLDNDGLLGASLSDPAVFQNFFGVLDGTGRSSAPAIALPAIPELVGFAFDLAFTTLSPASPCGFVRASVVSHVTVQ